MRNLLILILILLFCYCKNLSSDKKHSLKGNSYDFFEINYEKLLENKKSISLSQVALKVEYIQLETNNDCVIGQRAEFYFTDSLIFISNRNHVLKFSRSGKFLGRIGKSGSGPEEIECIAAMSVISDKKLIAVHNCNQKKLLYFTFNGKFVESVSIPRFEKLKVLNDGRLIAYNSGVMGIEEYNFELMNAERETLSFVKNNDKWRTTTDISLMSGYDIFKPFYEYRNRCYFKSIYNDTVYFNSEDKIVPGYFIDLGIYKLPLELRPEKIFRNSEKTELFFKKANEYFYCNVFEAANKIFLTTSNFKDKDPKYFLFNESSAAGNLLVNENGESTGFINDWDGGLDFWPIGNVSDNQVFMPINIITLKNGLERIKSKNESVIFLEKHQQLIKMISQSDVADNPILMIVTLK